MFESLDYMMLSLFGFYPLALLSYRSCFTWICYTLDLLYETLLNWLFPMLIASL